MNALPSNAYGLLLSFDGYGAPGGVLEDSEYLYSVLVNLPHKIGMRPLGLPQVISVEEPGIAGLSGFTFIMESHISIHTYKERGFVTVDIYSCKWFDSTQVVALLADAFQTTSHEVSEIVRGKRFGALPFSFLANQPHLRL